MLYNQKSQKRFFSHLMWINFFSCKNSRHYQESWKDYIRAARDHTVGGGKRRYRTCMERPKALSSLFPAWEKALVASQVENLRKCYWFFPVETYFLPFSKENCQIAIPGSLLDGNYSAYNCPYGDKVVLY